MKEFLKEFFKSDPCARVFRQRSIIAPYMGMCALNTRPLQELKFAIFTPPGHTFRGVPRREFLSRGGNFWRMHRRSEKLSGGPISGKGRSQTRECMPRLVLWSRDLELEAKRWSSKRRVFWYPTSFAYVTF